MTVSLAGDLASELQSAVSGPVRLGAPLNEISRWRIGGIAAALVEPTSCEEVAAVMEIMHSRSEPVVIIGETSNILFDSRGFNGVLVRIGQRMSRWRINGTRVHAQAGVSVPVLVRAAAEAGLGGIVHAAGIPGTLGGLVVMNGGTQRKGVGDHVVSAEVIDERGMKHVLAHDALKFAYRSTSLQGRVSVVVGVELELQPGVPSDLLSEVEALIEERTLKFPLDLPNCGSTFLSDPAMYQTVGPPGRAIEIAGLKGLTVGGAQISELHANFIVNRGSATDHDVLSLISIIRNEVLARTGFAMNCEVRHLSLEGSLRPAHEVADSQRSYSLSDQG